VVTIAVLASVAPRSTSDETSCAGRKCVHTMAVGLNRLISLIAGIEFARVHGSIGPRRANGLSLTS